MKKIFFICIALLFGCSVSAQIAGDYQQHPYAKYKNEQMAPDAYPGFPSAEYNYAQMAPDCFPPSAYSSAKEYKPLPPLYDKQNVLIIKYKPEKMKPDYPSYPDPCVLKPTVLIF